MPDTYWLPRTAEAREHDGGALVTERVLVVRMLTLIDSLEWSGMCQGSPCCPACGYEPVRHVLWNRETNERTYAPDGTHAPDCGLDAVRKQWEGFTR